MSYGFGGTYTTPAPRARRTTVPPAPRRAPLPRRPRPETIEAVIEEPKIDHLFFSVRGGLSPAPIVKKVEAKDEIMDENLMSLVNYALNHLEGKQEEMIAQTIRNRQEKNDYMVVVNDGVARPHTYLTQTLVNAATVDKRRAGVTFPFVDISIVSAEEGGDLEYRIDR